MTPIKVHQENIHIRSYDCDFMNTWRPSAILVAMQEAAGDHSQLRGCGRDELLKKNIVWILTRSEVHMHRYPRMLDTVTVETFPMPNRRWFFPRYFFFRDDKGETLGCGATLWALLDVNTRRMAPPGDVAACIPDNSDLTPPMGLPGTVEDIGGDETVISRTPTYFDLDMNQHVNNTRYADWACDALGVDAMREYLLSSFRVNYDAEVRPDQEVSLHVKRDGSLFRVAGFHDGKMHFEVGGELKKR